MIRKKKKKEKIIIMNVTVFGLADQGFSYKKSELIRLFKLKKKTFLEQFLCTNEKS